MSPCVRREIEHFFNIYKEILEVHDNNARLATEMDEAYDIITRAGNGFTRAVAL